MSNIVPFPSVAPTASEGPQNQPVVYQAEYDNGRSYSDHYHEVIGIFSTPEKAMDYCVAHNDRKYDRMVPWIREEKPFAWIGEWTVQPAVDDGIVRYGASWLHSEIAADEFEADHGGYRIFAVEIDPEPPGAWGL